GRISAADGRRFETGNQLALSVDDPDNDCIPAEGDERNITSVGRPGRRSDFQIILALAENLHGRLTGSHRVDRMMTAAVGFENERAVRSQVGRTGPTVCGID